MSDLSPRARRLIELGRASDEPASDARDRVRSRLMLAVGTGAAASAAAKGATAAGKLWAGSAMVKIAGGLCAVGIAAGGVTWVASTRAPEPQQQSQFQTPAVSQPPIAKTQPSAASVAAASSEPEPQTEAPRAPKPVVATRATASAVAVAASSQPEPVSAAASLEGEISLLREAQAALSRGNASRSLEMLQQHQAQYPKGAMSQEREAARVIALCKAGRRDEARTAASLFVEQHPDSPLASRVRGTCAR